MGSIRVLSYGLDTDIALSFFASECQNICCLLQSFLVSYVTLPVHVMADLEQLS